MVEIGSRVSIYLTKRISVFNNGSYQVESFSPPSSGTIYYMHKEDKESGVFLDDVTRRPRLRTCATEGGCPAVFVLNEPLLKVTLDKQWQYAMIAWNYNMTLEDVSLILDKNLAFCNEEGFRSGPRRNY